MVVRNIPGEPSQDGDVAKLQDEISQLRMLVDDMRQRSALESVLDRGLSDLNDKLAPLSSLLRRGDPLTVDEANTLAAIRASLKSPDYGDLEAPLVLGGDRKTPATKEGKPS